MLLLTALAAFALAASDATPTPSPAQLRHDQLKAAVDAGTVHFYPDRAQRYNVSGAAVIDCLVDSEGYLSDCTVVSETPADYGFGAAELQMAPLFKMKLTGPNAKIPGTRVQVPMNFKLPN